MKKVTIKAYNGRGENKVFAGELEVNKPDTLKEATEIEGGDESKVLAAYWSSEVIAYQNQIRTGSGTKADQFKAKLIDEAKADKAHGDPTFYNRLVRLGVISE